MTFKSGETSNPNGNNGHLKGYQRYADRAVYLQDKYSVEEIISIVSDPKQFGKLPMRDGQILKQLANSISGLDMRLERESLLDRIEGKPKELKEIKAEVGLTVNIKRFTDGNRPTGE